MLARPIDDWEARDGADGARRLAAIAFADVVGYSTLMASDERRTYERWMALLREVVVPETERRQGRIVDLAGDGALAEFPDAANAVEWAEGLQCALLARHEAEGAAAPAPIALRIGVHVGEVFVSQGRIFGDAVNVAARLQEHAVPGGIVLSEAVHGLLRGTAVGAVARDLGDLELKNIDRPARAYAIDTHALRGAMPARQPPRYALPSIAVLPLHNLAGDPANDYFADGVVEDVVVSLAGLHELFVISRASTLAFRGQRPDPRQVGKALGVRYVLTGSIRQSPRAIRVSVELCDAQTGATIWGDRMESPPGEVFDLQDEIVRKVVTGIAPNVRAAELRRTLRKRPESFTAYDHTLRALHILNGLDRATFPQARGHLERAMAEDPGFAMPVAWAARWRSIHVGQGWSERPDEDTAAAMDLAERAIQLDGQNALALATHGHLQSYLTHDYDAALARFDRALAVGPSHALAWILSSGTLSYVGRGEQAVRHAEQGLRLSPFDQYSFYFYNFLGVAHYANGDHEAAAVWLGKSAREHPGYTANLRYLSATLAALGRFDEARQAAARLLEREPDFRLSAYERGRQPFRDSGMKARFMGHLRAADLPE